MNKYGLIDLPSSHRRSDGIDSERAVLAIWVMFSHVGAWSAITGRGSEFVTSLFAALTELFQSNGQTHPAVLGFIVLSGYCIHRSGFRRTTGSVPEYGVRRFFRIWPVFFLATMVGIACFLASLSINPTWAISFSGTTSLSAECIAVKLSGVSTLFPSLHNCSFEGNAPLVTVAVEIWLYIVYAAVATLMFRRNLERSFWGALVVVWGIGVIYVDHHLDIVGWWHNGSLIGFLPYWWIGAAFVSDRFAVSVRRFWIPLLVMWSTVAALFVTNHLHSFFAVEFQQLSFALLFGCATVAIDRRNNIAFEIGAIVGRTGYSLYAFHAPIVMALLIAGFSWWVAMSCAFGFAILMHKLYERPLELMGKKRSRAKLARPSAISP